MSFFTAPEADFTEVNRLVAGYLEAHDQATRRDLVGPRPLSRFESNMWQHLQHSLNSTSHHLKNVCELLNKGGLGLREQDVRRDLRRYVASLHEVCPIGIHLDSFTSAMDEMQTAVYVYNMLDDSASDLLHQFMSGEAVRFTRLEQQFDKIVKAFEDENGNSFNMDPFEACGDIERFIDSVQQSEEIISVLSGLAYNYDPMPTPLFSERTFFN